MDPLTGEHRRVIERMSCDCGKWGYLSRRTAKAAARTFHPGDHLSAYRCPASGYWHYGHLQNVTRHGHMRRQQRGVS